MSKPGESRAVRYIGSVRVAEMLDIMIGPDRLIGYDDFKLGDICSEKQAFASYGICTRDSSYGSKLCMSDGRLNRT